MGEQFRPNNEKPINQWAAELSGEATLEQIEKSGRTFWVVSADHFSKKAGDFFEKDIAPQVTDPSEWLFAIEGLTSGAHEAQIALNIAYEHQTAVTDPVIDPFSPSLIKYFLKTELGKGSSQEEVIEILAAILQQETGIDDLHHLAAVFNTTPDNIDDYLALSHQHQIKSPQEYKAKAGAFWRKILEVSNVVSAQVFDYDLRAKPNAKKVAVYLGRNHREIVDLDPGKIPSELRLNDDEIRELLRSQYERAKKFADMRFGLTDEPDDTENQPADEENPPPEMPWF